MYSPYVIPDSAVEDQIVKIEVSELIWATDKTEFFYRWGWPGPDINRYTIRTYGKGWAFTQEEIIKSWENNNG